MHGRSRIKRERLAYTHTEREATYKHRERQHTQYTRKERQHTSTEKDSTSTIHRKRQHTQRKRDKEVRQTAQIQAFTGQQTLCNLRT